MRFTLNSFISYGVAKFKIILDHVSHFIILIENAFCRKHQSQLMHDRIIIFLYAAEVIPLCGKFRGKYNIAFRILNWCGLFMDKDKLHMLIRNAYQITFITSIIPVNKEAKLNLIVFKFTWRMWEDIQLPITLRNHGKLRIIKCKV